MFTVIQGYSERDVGCHATLIDKVVGRSHQVLHDGALVATTFAAFASNYPRLPVLGSMSAILSADDLNDFISPGVACIKPVETLPRQSPQDQNVSGSRCVYSLPTMTDLSQTYEVVKEDTLPEEHRAAEISLTDCLACSGCVTSAEAVLVSLQSHAEVLNSLDQPGDRIYVASVSPQVRASLAATYHISEREAGWLIDQLLGGPEGLASGGTHGSKFLWIVDTNSMREANLVLGAEEVLRSQDRTPTETPQDDCASSSIPRRPVLSSACPGWICYAEKSQPHVLSHLSRLKSPQALTGTLLKSVLSQRLNISPDRIWHLAVMPCFDKKLEASREELTHTYWCSPHDTSTRPPVRDVDCVITARELLMLADTRNISFPNLPRQPLMTSSPFPDPTLDAFLYPKGRESHARKQPKEAGTSGGYLSHILQAQLSQKPGATLTTTRGRNADVIEYSITPPSGTDPIFTAARYYGFKNIQNLVRKLRPPRVSKMPGARLRPIVKPSATAGRGGGAGLDYAYVEVMACPGGCTNGGGQIKIDDLPGQTKAEGVTTQKAWLERVDEAYFSMSDGEEAIDSEGDALMGDDVATTQDDLYSPSHVKEILEYWSSSTGIPLETLVTTSYRKVESDVGKNTTGGGDTEQVAEIAAKIAGAW